MNITNNSGGSIAIDRLYVIWVKSPSSQKLDQVFLNGVSIWNTSDPDTPSDIPAEGNWKNGVSLTIPVGATQSFLIQFGDALQPSSQVHIVFDIGCQVTGSR
jgi:hypothetical protein